MLLDSYRVLDLADHRGQFCGKILADLGADVIKVEPPEGDPARSIGPFIDDDPDPEKSLYWFAFNANKKSVEALPWNCTMKKTEVVSCNWPVRPNFS